MCLKLDLRKAFDSLNRTFLCNTLHQFGFHEKWVERTRECMNTSYSLLINWECTEPFHSSNGVRQGHPLSPYLFIITMQVLTMLLHKAEARKDLDPLTCSSLSVSHVIFADDLMIFVKADKKNARHLKLVLQEFTALSGLTINSSKSAIFFYGLVKQRNSIAAHLDLTQGQLPVKYLGLPLLSKRLSATACSPLLQAITMQLQTWKAKLLSYAGRTELIKSVLLSMLLY